MNEKKDNVLLICCDQLRGDFLGCNGHPVTMTPQLDKLAAQGINFRSAYSECPVCVPARRTIMTGLGPFGIHMNCNRDGQPFPEGPKLAELVTAAGHQSFASGKMHTCPQRNRMGFEDIQLNEEGRRQGDLRIDDYEAWLADHGHAHRAFSHGLGNNQYGMRLNPLPEDLTTTAWTAARAMEFLERRDPTRPFLLYVSFDKPHPPIVPTASAYELYRDAIFPAPSMGEWMTDKLPTPLRKKALWDDTGNVLRHPFAYQQTMRGYAAMVTEIDNAIGNLLGQLRERVGLDDTHIIFIADHGDHLFDHLAIAKSDLFKGAVHVPFIVRPAPRWMRERGMAPGRIDTTTPAGLADVMPTILDLLGLAIPAGLDGASLVGRCLDADSEFRRFTFGHVNSYYGATDGRFRYQWIADDDHEFLFDTHADPGERHDLSGVPEHQERLREFRSAVSGWMATNNAPHLKDGKMMPKKVAMNEKSESAVNHWNNRGRH